MLLEIDETQLLDAVWFAVGNLGRLDRELLEWRVNERSVTHKLAEHLRGHVDLLLGQDKDKKASISVDCEYNRFGTEGNSKQYLWKRDLPLEEDGEYYTPNPDIVVHERGKHWNNLLVVEVKTDTSWNPATELLDLMKVVGYLGDPTFYRLGLYLRLSLTDGTVVPREASLLRVTQLETITEEAGHLWETACQLLVKAGPNKRTSLVEITHNIQSRANKLIHPFLNAFGFTAIRPDGS